MEVFCGGCDDWRAATDKEIRRLNSGDVEFRCTDCRTTNTNQIPLVRADK